MDGAQKWNGWAQKVTKNIAKIHVCMMQSSSTEIFLTFECINQFNSNPFLLYMFYMIVWWESE